MKPNPRSTRWFDPDDFRSFGQRSRMAQMGYAREEYMGRPVIGIINTWSDINQCHSHFKTRVEDVKRGVLAGVAASRSSCPRSRCRRSRSSRRPCSIATSSPWRPRS